MLRASLKLWYLEIALHYIYENEIPKSDVHEFYRNFCLAIDDKTEQNIKNSEVRRDLSVIMSAFESAEENTTFMTEI